jgi:hypothetical protein
MKVGFLTNHISYGGTEVSLYDYAHYNEVLLGNKSIIITRDFRSTHGEIYAKFAKRFPVFYIQNQRDIDNIAIQEKLDVVYVQKSGAVDWFTCRTRKCCVHCVFTTNTPHGNIYAAISQNLNKLFRTQLPVVPYMVDLDKPHSDSFRSELSIPSDAIVVGRHGSYGSFDIPFVYEAILELLNKYPNMYFLALNTKVFAEHPRILYLPLTTELYVKRKFINTCDVMIHARARGETFGLACGEFAICKKPIITWNGSSERNHIETLADKCILYNNKQDILDIFEKESWKIDMENNGYLYYTPERVMMIFKQVFLS